MSLGPATKQSQAALTPGGLPKGRARFTVPPGQTGQRLDHFVAQQLPQFSRTRIKAFLDGGRVLVNGEVRKPAYHVETGETITVEIPPSAPLEILPENIPFEVLLEDPDVIVVNKPAGMTVHPASGAESGTLVAALLHRFGGDSGLSTIGGPLRPGVVHRLDKGTSGVLMIARNDETHRRLTEAFRNRKIDKTYLVLLHGKVKGDAGRIELPIARDLHRRTRMTTRRRVGREARTDWHVKLRFDGLTLIEAKLHTGRTHQIRVHFAALGCPVVGDALYGAPRQEIAHAQRLPLLERNFLHSARIGFDHPRTGERIEVRAPLPIELADYLEFLGRVTKTDPALIDAALREFL